MKIVIFGLSITSAWGNGHATTFRALARALHARGHHIIFFERNTEWYQHNRDLPEPPFCQVHIYESWSEVLPRVRRELADCDVAMVGSYFPHGVQATEEMLESATPVKTFYDIDTPITLAQLREQGSTSYLVAKQIPGLDVYFSFTGGPALEEIENRFGARRAVALYCSVDPAQHRPYPIHRRFACDLSYMGTYAADRQPKLDELFREPARRLPTRRFILAGPQYPKGQRWPRNVRRITHLNPHWHSCLYSSSRLTLNLTRRDMVHAGFSPSVRLFEAAACGAALISDNWPGLETFFSPQREILLPITADDVVRYLTESSDAELRTIGSRAQARVLAEHTSLIRAREFEQYVSEAARVASRLEPEAPSAVASI